MTLMVEHAGFSVASAAEGAEGLRVAGSVEHVCVVLLDLLMPGMNGWDFLDAFRASPLTRTRPSS